MSTYADVLRMALTLPAKDRRELWHAVFESLDGEEIIDDEPLVLSDAWKAEIARRSAEIDARTAISVPWEEVRERIQRRLRESTKVRNTDPH